MNDKLLSPLLLAALMLCAACASTGGAPPLQAVEALDTQRYLGSWYEIARTPNRFQRGCFGSTATYSAREDGTLDVRNECRDEAPNGPLRSISGKAWVVDPARAPAKLKVQFFWPFAANYWVVALDPDYRWAIVGEPSRRYLWILARAPGMDEALYASLLERAREMGYDPASIERTPQSPG